eukprot:CAMPEP_0203655336 /NCGR_PEP_ID=MMETSP0088-20131115/37953_1 /ASSEMBLY_ACC=CAM_ASM_001087 /TAXON_ID=426623 /ORGANISM="Chaetoceros affinis, Strain CCMP159" /LENGTH=39 /DNA_ID= /DNA_START= /DNA_END= /DNA_ORIENTATION=
MKNSVTFIPKDGTKFEDWFTHSSLINLQGISTFNAIIKV